MGTPIPPKRSPAPVPPGNDCDICWGIGKPLGGGPPPSQVVATVEGIEHGSMWHPQFGDAPEGHFILQQDELYPCRWFYYEHPYFLEWFLDVSSAEVYLTNLELTPYCDVLGGPCDTLFINNTDVRFKGGSVKITLPEIEE
jgi:hypothetical protein